MPSMDRTLRVTRAARVTQPSSRTRTPPRVHPFVRQACSLDLSKAVVSVDDLYGMEKGDGKGGMEKGISPIMRGMEKGISPIMRKTVGGILDLSPFPAPSRRSSRRQMHRTPCPPRAVCRPSYPARGRRRQGSRRDQSFLTALLFSQTSRGMEKGISPIMRKTVGGILDLSPFPALDLSPFPAPLRAAFKAATITSRSFIGSSAASTDAARTASRSVTVLMC
jgi:hypothetical protein